MSILKAITSKLGKIVFVFLIKLQKHCKQYLISLQASQSQFKMLLVTASTVTQRCSNYCLTTGMKKIIKGKNMSNLHKVVQTSLQVLHQTYSNNWGTALFHPTETQQHVIEKDIVYINNKYCLSCKYIYQVSPLIHDITVTSIPMMLTSVIIKLHCAKIYSFLTIKMLPQGGNNRVTVSITLNMSNVTTTNLN